MSWGELNREAEQRALFHARERDAQADQGWRVAIQARAGNPHLTFSDEATRPNARPVDPVDRLTPGVTSSGRLVDLADFDGYEDRADLLQGDAETCGADDADLENIRTRHSAFVWHCKNRAGEIVPQETKDAGDRAQAELRENTFDLAYKLAAAGVPAFLPKTAPRASIVDPETEQRIDLAPVRRLNFFPTVAKQRRDPVVKQLEAFCERQRCRMATFTAGALCFVRGAGAELRARVEIFQRRLSRLNDSALFRAHGAQMQFRGTEFGTVRLACPVPREPGTEGGIPLVHIHAHVVYSLAHQLSPRRWRRFLAKVKNVWRFHWGENGKLENIREAVKYPIKPHDTEHLEPRHVRAIHEATKGLHLVQPLGAFREEIAARRESALKLRRERDAAKRLRLCARPDWNAHVGRLTAAEKSARATYRAQERKRGLSVCLKAARLVNAAAGLRLVAALIARGACAWGKLIRGGGMKAGPPLLALAAADNARRARLVAVLFAQASRCDVLAAALLAFNPRPFAERRLSGVRQLQESDRAQRSRRPMTNRVCARLAPAPYFDRILRPAILVWNFTGDYSAVRAEPFVREYLDAVRPQIRRAEDELRRSSSFLKVHTSHTTAGDAGGAPGLLETAEAWSAAPPGAN